MQVVCVKFTTNKSKCVQNPLIFCSVKVVASEFGIRMKVFTTIAYKMEPLKCNKISWFAMIIWNYSFNYVLEIVHYFYSYIRLPLLNIRPVALSKMVFEILVPCGDSKRDTKIDLFVISHVRAQNKCGFYIQFQNTRLCLNIHRNCTESERFICLILLYKLCVLSEKSGISKIIRFFQKSYYENVKEFKGKTKAWCPSISNKLLLSIFSSESNYILQHNCMSRNLVNPVHEWFMFGGNFAIGNVQSNKYYVTFAFITL